MEILTEFISGVKAILPSAIAIILVVVVIIVTRMIMARGGKGLSRGSFRRQLVTLLLSFSGLLIVIMVLPMSDSKRGQLLSLLGILFTAAIALSSTTFLGNIMAGFMLRAIRNFRSGDFITVNENFGRVTERSLFHVEIQTENRDLVTLPNLYLITNGVKVVRASGTIISATVSLGYDYAQSTIEKSLLLAAEKTGLEDAFVHIIELGDFSVNYKIAGLLKDTKTLITGRSQLKKNMLKELHREKIEIVSPTFMNTRAFENNRSFIPMTSSDTDKKPEVRVEKIIFDKADEAESIENLKKKFDDLTEELAGMKKEPDESAKDIDPERYQARIDSINARLEKIKQLIKIKKERQESND